MKQVYLYDGTPFLLYKNDDDEYIYPSDDWTEIPPPNGIYSPFYFDGERWIGTDKNEWLSQRGKLENYQPSTIEMSQKEQAETLKELTKKEKRIQQLEEQQAQTMLEIAKLKGE